MTKVSKVTTFEEHMLRMIRFTLECVHKRKSGVECAQSEPKGALGRDTFMNGFAALLSAFS
jgi:hypothetical protein